MSARSSYATRPQRSTFPWGVLLVAIGLFAMIGLILYLNSRTLQSEGFLGAGWNDSPRVVDGKIEMSVYVPITHVGNLTLVSFLADWLGEEPDPSLIVHICDLDPLDSSPRDSGRVYSCTLDLQAWQIPSGARVLIQYDLNSGEKFWRSSPVKVKVP